MIYTQTGLSNSSMTLINLPKSDFEIITKAKITEISPKDKIDKVSMFTGQEETRAKAYLCSYFISGDLLNGKRKAENLISRRLLILDYDDLSITTEQVKTIISDSLEGYSYFLYPSTSYTPTAPRFRLVVDSERDMNEQEYASTVQDLAEQVGLPYDPVSYRWAQLQGLPITDNIEEYNQATLINYGNPYPISDVQQTESAFMVSDYQATYTPNHSKGKVILLLEEAMCGITDNRNIFFAKAVGILLKAKMQPDLAVKMCIFINENFTQPPLSPKEFAGVMQSITKREDAKNNA